MTAVHNDLVYDSATFQAFFKNSARSLLIKANSPQFTILAVSEAYLFLNHRERNDLIQHPFFEAILNGDLYRSQKDNTLTSFMRVIASKKADVQPKFLYEIPADTTGFPGTEYWLNLNEPLLDEEGNVAYIINTTTNITEQVKGQQAIDEAILSKQVLGKAYARNEDLALANVELSNAGLRLRETNEKLEENIVKRSRAFVDSEARFRIIVEQAPVAIATFMGPQFIIELFNNRVLEYWGRTADQVKGVPLFTALPEASGQGFEDLLLNVLTTGEQLVASELPVSLMRDGKLETTWINFIYDPLRDEYGTITGIIVVCNEVTDQVNARKILENIIEEKTSLENTLRESRQRLQGILDTMAEGVGIIDITGNIIYANSMAQKILGLEESEIKERSYNNPKWQNLRVDGSPLPDEEHPMSVMMRTQHAVYDYEIGIKPPGKDVFYISINAAPIIDGEGKLTGGIGTFMDVTNRRKLLEQKDEFISVASHELKTPLTALRASIQLLNSMKEEASSPLVSRLITQADTSVQRLSLLINDLLDVNRISRGQLLLRKTEFSMADLVTDCCQQLLTAGTHEIIVQGKVNKAIIADEKRIRQVMINLVSNAVKHAPHSKHIVIDIEEGEATIKVSVTDFGSGIPKVRIPNLFDRYYRANFTVGQGGGLGLGLYISSEIIKNHGGKIGANSEEGIGSTFWFTLPFA